MFSSRADQRRRPGMVIHRLPRWPCPSDGYGPGMDLAVSSDGAVAVVLYSGDLAVERLREQPLRSGCGPLGAEILAFAA